MTDDRRELSTQKLKEEMSESLTDHQVGPFYAFLLKPSLRKEVIQNN